MFTMGVVDLCCRLKLFSIVAELLMYCYFGFGFATV